MAHRSVNTDCAPRRGFTLAESLLASVLLATLVIGVGGALSAGFTQTAALRQHATAVALARELMEEISSQPFLDPVTGLASTGVGGPRSGFDCIGDFSDYHDTTSSLQSLGGQSLNIGDGQVYTRDVDVEYRTAPAGPAGSGDFAQVTVTVTTPNGQSIVLRRLVTNAPQNMQ